MSKSRGRRRRRYTGSDALRLDGYVYLEEFGPERDGVWPRFLHALVSQLPAFDHSQQGRMKAGLFRVAVGALAIYFVTARDQHWGVAVLGVVVALLTLFIPLADTQKVRWLARIRRLREPKCQIVRTPAVLFFDGGKIALKTDGSTWRSIRPFGDIPAAVGLFQQGSYAYLSLTRGKGRKRKELWMRSPVPEWEEWVKKKQPGRVPQDVEVFDLAAHDFVTLVEAFTGR